METWNEKNDGDISDESQCDESDEDNSRNGDPDYVPLVELASDDPPDSNGVFLGDV